MKSLEEMEQDLDEFLNECSRAESRAILLHVIEGMNVQDVEAVVEENVMDLR